MEPNKTLSARVAAILGGLVLSAISALVYVVWVDGRDNERRDAEYEHTAFRMEQLESDCKDFRRNHASNMDVKLRELRVEFVACRNRLESEIQTIRFGPSRYEAQGIQMKESLGDFRNVQKDVLHRLRMLEASVSMLRVKGTDLKN